MKKDNYISKLWRGNEKLIIVFWIYYSIISIIMEELVFIKIEESNGYKYVLFISIYYLYSLIMIKILWSTSNNYNGKKVWQVLTKIIIFIDLFGLLVLFPLKIFGIFSL